MTNQIYVLRSTSLRDGLSVVFRRKWLVLLCVVATISAALLAALVLPRYHGEAKILVNRERVDPILSPTPEIGNFAQPIVTDEDLRSEVEIMRSTEVLSEVVKEMDLIHSGEASWWSRYIGQPSDEEKISARVAQLNRDLVIEPAKGSYIINVIYKSKDREFTKRLMDKLIQVYLAKHTEVQHPAGQFKFFEQETGEYRDKMAAAEARLAEFPVNSGTVAPAMDRELTMQKLAEFKFSLGQARAAVAETEQRIQRLQQQEGSTPDRITTSVHRADNPLLLGQLKASLLSLELRRSELLTKYQPDYRPVKEIDQEIAQARADIQHELSSPTRDETTDLDATHQMIRSDLAKAQADLAGYKARVQETANIVNSYSERARELDAKSLLQADLERTFKAEEDNYLLYRKKTEEARITDALDANHMVNLAVVEKPLVPGLPSHSPVFFAVLAFMTMTTASVGLIGSLEYMDRTFHTPRQLEAYLDVPVLASIPRQIGPG
jgi:uncharacterized protein involved in exopolysaccharide biosynthesis